MTHVEAPPRAEQTTLPGLDLPPGSCTVSVRGRVQRRSRRLTVRQDPSLAWDAPLTPDARREAMAVALGVPERALAAMGARQITTAFDRLVGVSHRLRHLEAEAAVDELTGALRRGAGLRLLQAEIDRVRRAGGRLVLAFADVDGLKAVNDSEGHLAGDRLLRRVAGALRSHLRSYDLVIRYGGDEFLCVLSGAGPEEAAAKLEQITAELRTAMGRAVLSTGLAQLDVQDPDDDALRLVGRADAALYRGRARRR
jgi:diguanylate cyclase (GGDEF)-like protein